jgi:uncharacterized membrane protein YgcG
MKAWTWVLLFAVALLFMWTAREGFQDTIALRGPPYGESDYPAIVGMMPSTLVAALETETHAVKPILASNADAAARARYNQDLTAYRRKLVDGKISDVMGDFHTTVYQPAVAPIKEADINTFLTSRARTGFLATHKSDIKTLLNAYFVVQTPGAANVALTDAQVAADEYSASTGYDDLLAGLGQSADYTSAPTSGSGSSSSSGSSSGSGSSSSSGSGSSSSSGSGSSSSSSSGTTGGTTGGSGTVLASNSGGNKGNLWGPAYTGMGDNAGSQLGGGVRDYPTLLGPKPKESTMVEGAGITGPSQHQTLVTSGVLPGAAGTGSDPNSQFFGSSRVPGDRDLIPNPYQEFTPSVGSSKTEPVPFLSDFSAFFK